ncbi:hypothetical protein GQ53DRAFT_820428 [Thozetella sp. PMI_491]|nr:hypothetical protein GQ53DRAFT_820428 [Thozetella sp. PMI_491]
MSLPTLSALRENRKRRRDQQCGSEDEPAGVAPRNTTASPASSQQNSVVNHSPTLWSQSYLDELLHPVFGLDPLNAAQLGTPNHDIGSNGLDNRTPWQGSPAAMYANFGSRRSIPNCEPAVRVSPNQPENPDIGGDRAGTAPTISSGLSNRSIGMHSTPGTAPNEIPLSAAASFFRTYFSVIHPQYPFLDIKICSGYYTTWKSRQRVELAGWPAFFVNMIFAVGSLIEAKNDSSPYFQYQHLKSRAQSEQSIMTDSTSTPLIRLQAMLLSAMFALHAENTWRIAHISGVLMKFASLNGFNRLDKHAEDPDYLMSVRVWSCVYSLDRAVSSALGTPVSLPDLYISSPLFEVTLDTKHDLPWLADCDWGETKMYPDLQTFAHVCKIRAIQSFFMHMVEKDGLHTVMIPPELELHMQKSLRDWMDPAVLAKHRFVVPAAC